MKTYNGLFEQVCDFENLLAAAKAASRGKRLQDAVGRFNTGREPALLRLRDELLSHTYRPGPYRETKISVPKPRLISAAPFRDRVVHHAVCRIVMPLFEKKMIADLYSNRRGKGTHAAIRRCQALSQRHRYALKCDVSKYFPSIDHALLKQALRHTLRCRDTLWLLDTIIHGSNVQEPVCAVFPGDDLAEAGNRRVGLPLGNLTSQWFGNCFLSPFDHWVQERLRCGAYIRYVDDFVLFADDKATLGEWRAAIRARLMGMRLRLNETKSRVFPTAQGITFLGQRVWPHHRQLLPANARSAKRRFARLALAFAQGRIGENDLRRRWASWRGHALQAGADALVATVAHRFDEITERQGQYRAGGAAGRRVEQHNGQPALRGSQQQLSGQQQRQLRFSLCEGDSARRAARVEGRSGAVYGPRRRSHPKAHLTRPVSRSGGGLGTNTCGGPGASNEAAQAAPPPSPASTVFAKGMTAVQGRNICPP